MKYNSKPWLTQFQQIRTKLKQTILLLTMPLTIWTGLKNGTATYWDYDGPHFSSTMTTQTQFVGLNVLVGLFTWQSEPSSRCVNLLCMYIYGTESKSREEKDTYSGAWASCMEVERTERSVPPYAFWGTFWLKEIVYLKKFINPISERHFR